jgi:type IV secretion system protein VirD4
MDMNGFVESAELDQFRYRSGAFFLGEIDAAHGAKFEAGLEDDKHLFVVAGSRAGKGTSIIIPNLIRWQGGVLCVDPKGENASITAMRRGRKEDAEKTGTAVTDFIGQRVAILDPLGEVKGAARRYRVTYDPLSDIDIKSDDAANQIYNVIEAVVLTEQGGEHWTDSAGAILAGIIEHVLIVEDRKNHSFAFVRKLLGEGFDALEKRLKNSPITPAALAQEAAALLEDTTGDELSGFKSTLRRQMRWISDPRMQKHLTPSEFSLRQAMQENWSVYIVLPPRMMHRFKRWMRLIINTALDAKMGSPFEHQGARTLFVLDEFSSLGHFTLIEESAASMAGYGIKLMPVIQNLGQVRRDYGKNWETFIGNAGAICAFGLNDFETEEYIAKRMGNVMVWEQSYGESASREPMSMSDKSTSTSQNLGLRDRPVRWPNEVHEETARQTMRMFVILADGRPVAISRQDYTTLPATMYDSPAHIAEWEKRYAAHAATA